MKYADETVLKNMFTSYFTFLTKFVKRKIIYNIIIDIFHDENVALDFLLLPTTGNCSSIVPKLAVYPFNGPPVTGWGSLPPPSPKEKSNTLFFL